jgi:hypothetical protein
MNPEARHIIDLARQARTPTADDRARVRAAIGLSIAAVAMPTAAAVATAKTGALLGVLSGGRLALSALLIASVSVGGGAYYWWSSVRHRVEVKASPVVAVANPPSAPAPALVAPAPELEVVAAPPAERPTVEVRTASPAAQDPLLAEVTLLRRAQHAWQSGKPALALDLAQRHAQTYPRSQLALERGAVQVFALCALGRTGEARSLASDLLAKAPRSPLRTSLEESCAGGALK